jgi:hypothetical protein
MTSKYDEHAFFAALSNTDIWSVMKKFMYGNKKKSNIYNYRDGDIAAYYGYIEILKFEHRELTLSGNSIQWATDNGHLTTVQLLYKNLFKMAKENIDCTKVNIDCTKVNIDCTKVNIDCTKVNIDHIKVNIGYAAMNGHLETIKWLHNNNLAKATALAMDRASMRGHLEVVKWLHYNRTGNRSEGSTGYAMIGAAMGNHWDIVKWLYHSMTELQIQNECGDLRRWLKQHSLHERNISIYLNIVKWLNAKKTDTEKNDAYMEILKSLH